jgi:DNA-binding NarL/FixJ family response regulator
METRMIRVVVADDHTTVREGLKQLLAGAGDVAVVAEAKDGDDVLRVMRETDFDVLVLDMWMPGRNGIDLVKQVRAGRPKARVLVLTMHEDNQAAIRAIRAGASGWLAKEKASRQLIEGLRKVAAGGAFISPEVAEQLALGAMPGAIGEPHEALSDREYQVFRLLAMGRSLSEIAAELRLSVKTVSTHKTNILEKMNLRGAAELIRYAMDHRLIGEH